MKYFLIENQEKLHSTLATFGKIDSTIKGSQLSLININCL